MCKIIQKIPQFFKGKLSLRELLSIRAVLLLKYVAYEFKYGSDVFFSVYLSSTLCLPMACH